MTNSKNLLKMIVLSMLVALGVVISPILRVEGMCPMAHFVNIHFLNGNETKINIDSIKSMVMLKDEAIYIHYKDGTFTRFGKKDINIDITWKML